MGSEKLAIGEIVIFWRLAQEQFKKNKLISEEMFKINECSDNLFICDLAEKTPDGIRAKGDLTHFGWIIGRQEAGRAGAKITNEKRWGKKRESNDINNLVSANDQQSVSKRQPPTLTLTHTLKKKNNTYDQNHFAQDELERLYVLYPRKIGRQKGLKILAKQIKNQTELLDLERAIKNYSNHVKQQDPKYIKHWSTFANEWRDWIEPIVENGPKTVVDLWYEKSISEEADL
jgi:hypothetical protein